MTGFTTAMLPGGAYAITTVEELMDWGNAVLCFNNPTETELEALNTNKIFRNMRPELRIPEGKLIRVVRNMLTIDETKPQNLPSWKRIIEHDVANIPSGFKIS